MNRVGNRDNNFIFIKLFAGISVLMGHLSLHMQIPGFGYGVGTEPFYHVGVPFFLMLTAFFLYPSFSKLSEKGDSISNFYFRRFIRVAPSIYFITVISLIIFLVVGAVSIDVFKEISFWAWITSNLTLLPVYHPDIFSHIGVGVLNGSLWTIFAQVTFYLMIPFIYFFEVKYGSRKMMVSLFAVAFLFYFLSAWMEGLDLGILYLFERLFSFSAFGNLIYFALGIFWAKYWFFAPKGKWVFALSIMLLYVVREDIFNLTPYLGDAMRLLWVFPLTYATIWFGYLGPKLFRKFNKIEDIGMGIYIWHMIIINLFLYLGLDNVSWLNGLLMFPLVILITVILAYASRIYVEKPFMQLEFKRKHKQTKAIN